MIGFRYISAMRVVLVLPFLFSVPVGVMGGNQNASFPSRPTSVTIGAMFTFDSVIGRAAQAAIAAAVDDVNADLNVLAGTKLNIIMVDTTCSGFLGIIEGMRNSAIRCIGITVTIFVLEKKKRLN